MTLACVEGNKVIQKSFSWLESCFTGDTDTLTEEKIFPDNYIPTNTSKDFLFSIFYNYLHQLYYPEQEIDFPRLIERSKTQTLDAQLNGLDFVYLIVFFNETQKSESLELKSKGQDLLLLEISNSFSKIKEVESIYIQRYSEEIQIRVLLSTNEYDDNLMDCLLDKEYDIRKKHSDTVFDFFYIPGEVNKRTFIHSQATCIYLRTNT